MISKDRRPRDWTYVALFDSNDLPSLQNMIKHIGQNHDTAIIEDFNIKCEQKLVSDQDIELDNGIKLEAVAKTEDLVTNAGLNQCINLIIGTNSTRFAWLGAGLVLSPYPTPAITDTVFVGTTVAPVPTSGLDGWAEARGMKLFFGAIVSELQSGLNIINELGVINSTSPGYVLLNHEIFGTNPISRTDTADGTMRKQIAIISSVIEFCPVAGG